MSCVNILDNDTTLLPPTFGGARACMHVGPPTASCGAYYGSDSASVALTFKPDGTWELAQDGSIRTLTINGATCQTVYPSQRGVIATGQWITGTFNPADYEIRIYGTFETVFTGWPSNRWGGSDICQSGSYAPPHDPPLVVSPWGVGSFDTGWLPMNSPRATQIGRSRSFAGGTVICERYEDREQDFTVEIRQISNPANKVAATGSICFRLEYQG